MDNELIQQYASAVHARFILRLLPDGIREYAQQYETLLLDDIRHRTGKLELTESEVLAIVPSTTSKIIQALLPIAGEIALALLKKYAPTIAASGTIGAIIATYLTK